MKKLTLAVELIEPLIMPDEKFASRSSGASENFCREIAALQAKSIKVKFLGRPKKLELLPKVEKLLSDGKTIRAIAAELKVSTTTIQAIKKLLPKTNNYRK